MTTEELYIIFQKHPYVCTDTRKIENGSLFFALKGENFNGNKFADKAIKNGCVFAIIDEKEYANSSNTILVDNVLVTLQELATLHRKKLNIPIIGITGTNGKTTSKELINEVLSSAMKCYSTKGNLNNHIGVPLSILEIKNTHKIAIIEMGASHKGEINFLCNISKPTHGVITNIGSAHLEGFKNLQGVIDTKKELYNFLKETNGHLFVNNDDDLLLRLSEEKERTTYGNNGNCKGVKTNNTPFISVEFNGLELSSNLIGDYQFHNIMLAICIGNYFEITNENIKKVIEDYTPRNNRSEVVETKNNTLILDAYNANPSSMLAMLNSFSKQNYDNKLCILGDMLELGEYSKLEHKSIINLCEKLELECIYVGEEFNKVSSKAFSSRVKLEEYLQKNSIKNKNILLKGSRGIGLEKLEKYL
jgi:UDP-N-acetylmuramoyl-tripeptide--D-alanyl-D-alanine ligase